MLHCFVASPPIKPTAFDECAAYSGYFGGGFQLTDSPGASPESFLGVIDIGKQIVAKSGKGASARDEREGRNVYMIVIASVTTVAKSVTQIAVLRPSSKSTNVSRGHNAFCSFSTLSIARSSFCHSSLESSQ